jgi:DNA polymerase III subunit epsilon
MGHNHEGSMAPNVRQNAIRKAKELLMTRPLFMDTETTGLGIDDEIIEIAILDHEGLVVFEQLVKPQKRIPADATRLHGITNECVQSAPTWEEIWPEVSKIIQNRYVGTYNADFDLRMLQQTNAIHQVNWKNSIRFFCVMKLYAEYYHYGGGRYQKLEDAGRQCGIALPNSHRAKDDTNLAIKVFEKIAKSSAY